MAAPKASMTRAMSEISEDARGKSILMQHLMSFKPGNGNLPRRYFQWPARDTPLAGAPLGVPQMRQSGGMPYCRDLHDRNETLYFALLVKHFKELAPIVYTPTGTIGVPAWTHVNVLNFMCCTMQQGLFCHRLPWLLRYPRLNSPSSSPRSYSPFMAIILFSSSPTLPPSATPSCACSPHSGMGSHQLLGRAQAAERHVLCGIGPRALQLHAVELSSYGCGRHCRHRRVSLSVVMKVTSHPPCRLSCPSCAITFLTRPTATSSRLCAPASSAYLFDVPTGLEFWALGTSAATAWRSRSASSISTWQPPASTQRGSSHALW